jgi:DNA-binding Lrp family transcriptional regulator
MVNAFVLVSVEHGQVNRVAQELAALDGVTEVYSVAGQFDLLVVVRAADNDGLAEIITGRMLGTKGIARSQTLIAFRVFSRYDLEHLFSIGMEGR